MDGKRGKKLEKATRQVAERMREAENNRPTLFAQTAFLSSLAVMFVLPVVITGYLFSSTNHYRL